MKMILSAVLPVTLAGFIAVGAASSARGGDKAVKKAQIETIKLANLTADTPAKEIKKLNKALKKVKGVKKVTVTKKKGELKVKLAAPASLEAVHAAITAAGFTVADQKKPADADELIGSDDGADDEGGAQPLDE